MTSVYDGFSDEGDTGFKDSSKRYFLRGVNKYIRFGIFLGIATSMFIFNKCEDLEDKIKEFVPVEVSKKVKSNNKEVVFPESWYFKNTNVDLNKKYSSEFSYDEFILE